VGKLAGAVVGCGVGGAGAGCGVGGGAGVGTDVVAGVAKAMTW
jgi:hypothetical protein